MSYAMREVMAAFRRAPVLTGLSIAMIALSLFVVGLFGIAAHNIRLVLDRVESRVEVVAYLRDDAPNEAVELALSEIRSFPEVLDVIYVSRDSALEAAKQELPEFRAAFTDLEVNPLPASFELRLRPGYRDPQAVAEVAARLGGYTFVEDIRFGREWLDKIYLLRRIAGAAAMIVGVAFAVVAALIIGAAVRMAIFARRDEISIMRLVGATDGFVQRPFLLEGFMTGVVGAAIALGLVYAVYRLVFNSVFALEWIPSAWAVAGLAVGGILGVLASSSAVRRHLQEI